jgi:hypothetical protein
MPVDLFEAAGVAPPSQDAGGVDLFQAAGVTPPPSKPSLTIYGRMEKATMPSEEFVNQPLLQKLYDLPGAMFNEVPLAAASSALSLPANVITQAVTSPFVGGKRGEELGAKAGELFQFQPQTEMGKYLGQQIASPFTVADQYVGEQGGPLGQYVMRLLMSALPFKGKVGFNPKQMAFEKLPQFEKPQPGTTTPASGKYNWRGQVSFPEEAPPFTTGGLEAGQMGAAQKAAGDLNLSRTVFGDSITDKFLTGVSNLPGIREYTNRLRRQTNDTLVGELQKVKGSLAGKEEMRQFQEKKGALYEQALNTLGDEPVQLAGTQSWLESLLDPETGLKNDTARVTVMSYLEQAGREGGFTKDMINNMTKDKKLGATRGTVKDRIVEDLHGLPGGEEAAQAIKDMDVNFRFQNKSKTFNRFWEAVTGKSVGSQTIIDPLAWQNKYEGVRGQLLKFHPDLVEKLDQIDLRVRMASEDLGQYMQWEQNKGKPSLAGTVGGLAGLGQGAGIATGMLSPASMLLPAGAGAAGALLTRSSMKPGGMLRPKPGLNLKGPTIGDQFRLPFENEETPGAPTPKPPSLSITPPEFENQKPYSYISDKTREFWNNRTEDAIDRDLARGLPGKSVADWLKEQEQGTPPFQPEAIKPTTNKPKSLSATIKEMGGIAHESLRTYSEDPSGEGFLNFTKKGGRAVDDIASELQSMGKLGPTPDGYSGPGDFLVDSIRQEKITRIGKVEKRLTTEERGAISKLTEEWKNEGLSDDQIKSRFGNLQRDIEKEVVNKTLEELNSRAHKIVDEDFIDELEEPPQAPPPKSPTNKPSLNLGRRK